MKIAIYEADSECKELFKPLNANLNFYEKDINHVLNEKKDYDAISIFVHSKIDKKMLNLLPNLKYIQTRSTGFDHIDIDECKKRGIIVSNVKGYAGPTVSEYVFSLILNLTRKTYIAIQRTKKEDFYYKDLLGIELFNKTISVIGLGTIGKNIAKIANGFGMKIKAHTPHFDEEFCKKYNISKSSYPEILKDSDIIVFAVPLTKKTYHMLNEKNISLIKNSAIIINIARGEVISKEALNRLKNRIFGLGLDVIENEKKILKEKPKDFIEFIKEKNVLYTPHMAYYTKEALQRIREISFNNMKNFIEKKEIINIVN